MQCDIGECDNSQVGDYVAFSIGNPPFPIPSQPDLFQDNNADQNCFTLCILHYVVGR